MEFGFYHTLNVGALIRSSQHRQETHQEAEVIEMMMMVMIPVEYRPRR